MKEFIKNPDKNFGFVVINDMKVPDGESGNMSDFFSSEASDLTLRPKLTITDSETSIKDKDKYSHLLGSMRVYSSG